MRPHGRASISARQPRALGVCDRCNFLLNHDRLVWQYEWRGPRLQNIRLLVCESCYDKPQEQLRTIVLPPDPVTIQNARPEAYASDDNPLSPLGFDATHMYPSPPQFAGANIGNLTLGGGRDAAFNGVTNKRFDYCANLANSVAGLSNFVGKNWAGDISGITTPSSLAPPIQTHIASGFTMIAPNDRPFYSDGSTAYQFQGSNDGVTYTTLYLASTIGTIGEIITVSLTGVDRYQYHRAIFNGNGLASIAIAQLQINVADAAPNDV